MNKKTLLVASILALQALVTATACKPKAAADSNVSSMAPDSGVRYVAPKDGLNMREEPSTSGKKILTIPRGAQVQKLEERPESFRVDNIDGKWTKISWQGKTGWVFGGFLSISEPNQGGSTGGVSNINSTADAASDSSESIPLHVRNFVWVRTDSPGEAIAFNAASYIESGCRGVNGEYNLKNLKISGDKISGFADETEYTFSFDGNQMTVQGGPSSGLKYKRSSYRELGDWANAEDCIKMRRY